MKRTVLLALALLTAHPLHAQARLEKPEPLQVVAINLTAESDNSREDGVVLPGDTLEYRLLFTNVTGGVVKDVVFENPIPQGLAYLAGSAGADREDVHVTFSIDGGTSFSATPMIEVEEDGHRVQRSAPTERYTHVRWTVQNEVPPGASVTAIFRARVLAGGQAP